MQRRTFLAASATALSLPFAPRPARPAPARPSTDKFNSPILSDVHLRGRLGRALDLCVKNRLAAQDWQRLVAAFQTRNEERCWQSEFWGKWFTAAAAAYGYTRDPKLRDTLVQATRGLMATQTPDGYIGNYRDDKHLAQWDVWGRKYCLLGLLASYEITRDPATLACARRLADHLMTEVGPGKADIVKLGNHRGMAASSVLEPMVLLHRATGEPRYRAFAEYIIGQWSQPDGPQLIEKALAGVPVGQRFPPPKKWWSNENGIKAYEQMSCYEGLLEMYRLTGTAVYLEAARKTAADIRKTEMIVTGSGSSVECWYGGARSQAHPAKHMQETCVTATWMKLCANLLRLTGDATLFDDIERAAYNALLASMTPDGTAFAKYSPLEGFREIGELQCGMGLHCCTASAPRGLFVLPRTGVMLAAEGPVVNLYERGDATVSLPNGARVTLVQETTYPVEDTVRIEVRVVRPARFTLALRIPGWSEANQLTVNGTAAEAPAPGSYARLERTWAPGDKVMLKLDLRARAVPAPDGSPATAIVRGPVVLARDSRLGAGDVDEVVLPKQQAGGIVPLTPVEPRDERVWMHFRVPFTGGPHDGKGQLDLCDYASAGNSWERNGRLRVWMPREIDPSKPA